MRQAVAQYESAMCGGDVTEDQVVMTAGAREALHWSYAFLKTATDATTVMVVGPQYPAIHTAIGGAGLDILECLDISNPCLEPPIEEVVELIAKTRPSAIHLTNPGNPSGRLVGGENLSLLLRAVADVSAYLVVDKALSDIPSPSFHGYPKVLAQAAAIGLGNTVLIVDSLSKRRSLAGLRIGYLVSMNQKAVDWIGMRLMGGTQCRLGLQGLITDLTASAHLAATKPEGQLDREIREVSTVVYSNHNTIVANRHEALRIFGELVTYCSEIEAGQNCVLRFDLPARVTDIEMVETLVREGVGSYPLSCFLAREPTPVPQSSIRLTLSTPAAEFAAACQTASAVIKNRWGTAR